MDKDFQSTTVDLKLIDQMHSAIQLFMKSGHFIHGTPFSDIQNLN